MGEDIIDFENEIAMMLAARLDPSINKYKSMYGTEVINLITKAKATIVERPNDPKFRGTLGDAIFLLDDSGNISSYAPYYFANKFDIIKAPKSLAENISEAFELNTKPAESVRRIIATERIKFKNKTRS